MKILQTYQRNTPTTAGGYSITIQYTYSSNNPEEIDEIEKKLPSRMIIMDINKSNMQEEKPLRCDKCSCHREDGWCGMHGRWVKETDYCSLGAWKES